MIWLFPSICGDKCKDITWSYLKTQADSVINLSLTQIPGICDTNPSRKIPKYSLIHSKYAGLASTVSPYLYVAQNPTNMPYKASLLTYTSTTKAWENIGSLFFLFAFQND